MPKGRSHRLAPFRLLSVLAAEEEAGSVEVFAAEEALVAAELKCEVGSVVVAAVGTVIRSTGLAG